MSFDSAARAYNHYMVERFVSGAVFVDKGFNRGSWVVTKKNVLI
jgi:hypothetical protein